MTRILILLAFATATALIGGCAEPAVATAPTVAKPATPATTQPLVTAVEAIGITVSDMDRGVAFYRDVLTFELLADSGTAGKVREARLQLGDERIVLAEHVDAKGRPIPYDSRSNDLWFQHIAIITSDIDMAYRRLVEHHVELISPGPQRLPESNPAAGGIAACYFHDPDGHPLEILQFPPGKGQEKWHRPTNRLLLGIDHTAIVVSDTAPSLEFYCDLLGMKVVGMSLNFGPEQERLNQVPGARLRITSLRAEQGPGVELLEYVSPPDGRPIPTDTKPGDMIHWQTIVTTAQAELAAMRLNIFKQPTIPHSLAGGLAVADPDRHALLMIAQ